jgi:hypothetical protein
MPDDGSPEPKHVAFCFLRLNKILSVLFVVCVWRLLFQVYNNTHWDVQPKPCMEVDVAYSLIHRLWVFDVLGVRSAATTPNLSRKLIAVWMWGSENCAQVIVPQLPRPYYWRHLCTESKQFEEIIRAWLFLDLAVVEITQSFRLWRICHIICFSVGIYRQNRRTKTREVKTRRDQPLIVADKKGKKLARRTAVTPP